MKRHVVDGAEILRGTPEIPSARACRGLRTSPADRRHRLPARRVATDIESRDDAVRHRGRVRRDAVAAQVPAGIPVGAHPGGAAAQRRQAVRSESGSPFRAAARHLSGRQSREARTPAKSPSCCRCTRPIRIARKCACSSPPTVHGSSCRATSTCGRSKPTREAIVRHRSSRR